MLIEKICKYEKGFNETICDNLSEEKWDDYETEGWDHWNTVIHTLNQCKGK